MVVVCRGRWFRGEQRNGQEEAFLLTRVCLSLLWQRSAVSKSGGTASLGLARPLTFPLAAASCIALLARRVSHRLVLGDTFQVESCHIHHICSFTQNIIHLLYHAIENLPVIIGNRPWSPAPSEAAA